jgi:hypothetical protein
MRNCAKRRSDRLRLAQPEGSLAMLNRITARWLALIPLAALAVALFWAWN